MADTDGITSSAARPPDPRRPLRTPPSELLPIESAVFEAIHRFNSRCERLLHDFRNLQAIPYFSHDKLTAWQTILGRIQAEANFHMSQAIHTRAGETAAYFDRLCARRERELADPDDVLIEAEHRKQELAEQHNDEHSENKTGENPKEPAT